MNTKTAYVLAFVLIVWWLMKRNNYTLAQMNDPSYGWAGSSYDGKATNAAARY